MNSTPTSVNSSTQSLNGLESNLPSKENSPKPLKVNIIFYNKINVINIFLNIVILDII